jgi:hypothetical protein
MPRTLMQKHRIIALFVVSTLYNSLWSDSRSGHFTQLCLHVHHEWHFVGTVIFETKSVCFYSQQLAPSQETFFEARRQQILQNGSLFLCAMTYC